MKEALLYDRLEEGRVKCNVCRHRCTIPADRHGYCGGRYNREGVLYSLLYGRVSSMHTNPIEMKPLFHFYPGSLCFSIGSYGCNFRCPGCQNWEISRKSLDEAHGLSAEISPEKSIELTFRTGCTGISWTFNEPTIWLEYTLEGARLAKQRGLYTVYVTNGYITPEALDLISPYLDAFRVDIKGFSEDTYKKITSVNALSGVLDSAIRAKRQFGMHVECVTNLTPGVNDSEEELRSLAGWIKEELGVDTPWHITRFIPHLELSDLPSTPIAALEAVREMGFDAGLRYVYLGNVPGHRGENTYCYNCGTLLIVRNRFSVRKNILREGRCPKCGIEIYGIFSS
jgi:pyruvate formate lyase activating enzyme